MVAPSPQRPGGLTALCVLSIVLGSMGFLSGLVGLVGMLFQNQMQSAVAGLQPDADMARIQQEVNEQTNELMRQHAVRNWILLLVRLNVAIGLLLGGIWSLGLKPIGRMTLLVAFGVGIVLEAFQLWPQWENRNLAAQTMDRMVQAQKEQNAKAPPGFDDTMKMMGQVAAAMTIVVALGMFLAKSGFYAFGLWYLTRPHIAGLFVRQKPVDPQWA